MRNALFDNKHTIILNVDQEPLSLLAQVAERQIINLDTLELAGDPLCWSTPHLPGCPSRPHRHLIWKQGPSFFRTTFFDGWQRQVSHATRRTHWNERRHGLETLLALSLVAVNQHCIERSSLKTSPEEHYTIELVRIGGYRLHLTSQVAHFLVQVSEARRQYKLEQDQASFDLAVIDRARTLAERLDLLGLQVVHPALFHLAAFPQLSWLFRDSHAAWRGAREFWPVDWSWSEDFSDLSESEILDIVQSRSDFFWLATPSAARSLSDELRSHLTQLVLSQEQPLHLVLAEHALQVYSNALLRYALHRASGLGFLPQEEHWSSLFFEDLPDPTRIAPLLELEQNQWARSLARIPELYKQAQGPFAALAPLSAGLFLLQDGLPLSPTAFWQLPERPLLTGRSGKFQGIPLAQVFIHTSECPSWPHTHVLWKKEQLYRTVLPFQREKDPEFVRQRKEFLTVQERLSDFYALQCVPGTFQVVDAKGRGAGHREIMINNQVVSLSSPVFRHLCRFRRAIQDVQARHLWLRLQEDATDDVFFAEHLPLYENLADLAALSEDERLGQRKKDKTEEKGHLLEEDFIEDDSDFFLDDEDFVDESDWSSDYLSGAAREIHHLLRSHQLMLLQRARVLGTSPLLRKMKRFAALSPDEVYQRLSAVHERFTVWDARWQDLFQRLHDLPQVFLVEQDDQDKKSALPPSDGVDGETASDEKRRTFLGWWLRRLVNPFSFLRSRQN